MHRWLVRKLKRCGREKVRDDSLLLLKLPRIRQVLQLASAAHAEVHAGRRNVLRGAGFTAKRSLCSRVGSLANDMFFEP